MFLRVIFKSITHRLSRVGVAMLALVVGAAVASAMLSVYYDAGLKMRRELRAYGANVMLAPAQGQRFIDQRALETLRSGRWEAEVIGAVPYLYAVADYKPAGGDPVRVILTGLDFAQARKVSPWWKVSGSWPDSTGVGDNCVVGADLATQLGLTEGKRIDLTYGVVSSGSTSTQAAAPPTVEQAPSESDKAGAMTKTKSPVAAPNVSHTYTVCGIVTTGGSEDGQILMPLQAAQELTGLNGKLSAVAISALGPQSSIESFASQVDARIPTAKADLVRQISESEGRVLGKLRLTMLLVTLLILIAASLSVATTLTALVMDRQKEIGTMKAIGAREGKLLRQFLFELGTLGVFGGIVGYLAGILLAQPIGRSMFQSPVTPRIAVFGLVLFISIAVALVSGLVPLRRIRNLEPAVILRGD